jgi:uncharacterized protein YkuJ
MWTLGGHGKTVTGDRQAHLQTALVDLQQRKQFTENARDVTPVDFIHEQEKFPLRRVAGITAEAFENAGAARKDKLRCPLAS